MLISSLYLLTINIGGGSPRRLREDVKNISSEQENNESTFGKRKGRATGWKEQRKEKKKENGSIWPCPRPDA